jgi:Ca2+-binding EF-hand superfamily protein
MNFIRELIFGVELDIAEEELEEYRMMSGLDPEYICRLRRWFRAYIHEKLDEIKPEAGALAEEGEEEKGNTKQETKSKGLNIADMKEEDFQMTKAQFMEIPFILQNPIQDRIAFCFGYENDKKLMNFPEFLVNVAMFNSHGKKEEKIKLSFRIQDFDGDGFINKSDFREYLEAITGSGEEHQSMGETEIEDVITLTFAEVSTSDKGDVISLQDFSHAIATTDFYTKLYLPFE